MDADNALVFKANIPLAVGEAKDNQHAVGAGMAQAINYAQLPDVPFSFSATATVLYERIVIRVEELCRLSAACASQTTQAHLEEALVESVAG